MEVNRNRASVELGEGVQGHCTLTVHEAKQEESHGPVDVSALSSMLASKWKGAGTGGAGAPADSAPKSEQLKAGQIRSFRIAKIDTEKKKIDLELVG
jgi:small subunit ribosomal protein S1